MNKYYLGVDLGGTKIIGLIIDEKYNIIEKITENTGDTAKEDSVMNKILAIITKLTEKYNVEAIGIGSAGFVNYNQGVVLSSPNIKFLNKYKLSKKIKDKFHIETFIENDVKAGAIAELYLGEGKRISDFVFITLGTGIGAAIIANGKLIRGKDNLAGEIGHLKMVEKGIKCGCGKRGCLETISSGPSIKNYVLKEISKNRKTLALDFAEGNPYKIDVIHIVKAAKEGDEISRKALILAVQTFAKALSNVINLLNPEKIIIGGGLRKAYEVVMPEFYDTLKKYALEIALKNLKIVPAQTGNEAVAVGAAIIGMLKVSGKDY